jgi:hypothetical protein
MLVHPQDSPTVDWAAVQVAATDAQLIDVRRELVSLTVRTFAVSGDMFLVGGHIFGSDRVEERSPFGHGCDETVAVGMLLRIGGELVWASHELFRSSRQYAAAALLRQLVEIEYLAWAFDTNDREGEKWLRSTSSERRTFFTPAKLRRAAGGRFRAKDYGYHCELGGHPVPGATVLLGEDVVVTQFLLSDLLGHAGRIWNHVVSWAKRKGYEPHLHELNAPLVRAYGEWAAADPLYAIPPPQ